MGIGTIIGGGTALASSIIGAIGSSVANKKANKLINVQKEEITQWYNRNKAQDYTKRLDSQAILKKQRELLDEHYKNARATNIVAGGSDAALAQQQEAANQSLDNTMTTMAGQAASYKDSIEQQYMQQNNALAQQQVAVKQGQAQQIAAAAGQGVAAGLNLIGTDINKSNK